MAINYLFPVNPERLVERAARPIFEKLAAVLEEVAGALEDNDRGQVEAVLEEARELDEPVRSFDEALSAGYEIAHLSPTRRRSLKHLELYAGAGIRIELTVINTRVLARGAANVFEARGGGAPTLPGAVRDLSRAVRALANYLQESEGPEEARRFALEAGRGATETLKERHDLAASVLVGQVRSMAVDLFRSTGINQAEALAALEEIPPEVDRALTEEGKHAAPFIPDPSRYLSLYLYVIGITWRGEAAARAREDAAAPLRRDRRHGHLRTSSRARPPL